MVGVPLEELSVGEGLARSGVGGIFLAGRSDAAATDLAATVTVWQSTAPGPGLWVAADQEGGAVQTLRGPGFEPLPSALDQGALPPGELAALADRLGASLQSAGVNLDLAPVADIVPAGTESREPARSAPSTGSTAAPPPSWSPRPATVVDGLAGAGVTATLKHFPGLGRVRGNTDTTADVVDSTTTAGDEQVAAFARPGPLPRRARSSWSRRPPYTQLDPDAEAAFSPIVLTDLLRGQLGFDGVVISDDFGTAAAVQDVPAGERAVRFLAAGGTLVLTVDPAIVPDDDRRRARAQRRGPGVRRHGRRGRPHRAAGQGAGGTPPR